MNHLVDLAASVVRKAQHLGAEQASVSVSLGSHTMLTRRDSKVEQVTEATTHGLALSLMVDERYSVHSTSDMRPQAMEAFLTRAIAATRYLEPDPARRQPDIAQCGRGISQTDLELLDPSWQTLARVHPKKDPKDPQDRHISPKEIWKDPEDI